MAGRFLLIVLDSVGIGEMPDAAQYGDAGSHTLGNLAKAVGGLKLPNLERLGLGNIAPIQGVAPAAAPAGSFGKMAERSPGKDTTTGHWEMMGVILKKPLALFPKGFPDEIVEPWLAAIGAGGVLGNEAASGTEIIKQLGAEHQRTGWPILYTSADSVFQVACHEETVPVPKLYAWCEAARRLLDPYQVARVIARPFVGAPGSYKRTYNRKDFSLEPPGETALDRLAQEDVPVVGVGKIPDIFCDRGIARSVHTEGNTDGLAKTKELLDEVTEGMIFVNLVDTDMLYGHRNDVPGYRRALEEIDAALPGLLGKLGPKDVLAITADHGCDPTTPSTDHSREYVPILAHCPSRKRGAPLGTRRSFADLGQTVLEHFGLRPMPHGESFLGEVI
ncbi:MAG TPA: phosphopentomutase [Myxococcales bacterium]|nr:phosphopentomutase [Myxococcales bacterium]